MSKNKKATNHAVEMRHGWLLPTLLKNDDDLWGRWRYWYEATQSFPHDPIPEIYFCSLGNTQVDRVRKMIERSLDAIPKYGGWQGWDSANYFHYFTDWLLWSFGYGDPDPPNEPEPGAAQRLQSVFDLRLWQEFPYDYLGDLMAESRYGSGAGFFPTPLEVASLMARMNCSREDSKLKSINDCALGTGRMLLAASNKSLILTGNDVLPLMLKVTLVNGYIMAPWLAKGIPNLSPGHRLHVGNTLKQADFYPMDELTLQSDPVIRHYAPRPDLFALKAKLANSTLSPLNLFDPLIKEQVRFKAQVRPQQEQLFQTALAFGIAMETTNLIGKGVSEEKLNWAINYGPTFLENFPHLVKCTEGKTGRAFSELCEVLAILKFKCPDQDIMAILMNWLDE